MTDTSYSGPHLILHLVRGEPEFGVAEPMERNDETWWIVSSSGHRAYPYKWWPICDLVDTSDINYSGHHPRPIDSLDTIPEGWPDHYQTTFKIGGKPLFKNEADLEFTDADIDKVLEAYRRAAKKVKL